MGKNKKETMEFRFYEVPQNEYVLPLLGEKWICDYGPDESKLHFHNLMEIGFCRNGQGKLILDDDELFYQPGMLSIIPHHFPHVTVSDTDAGPSYWEYLFLDPVQIMEELYPDNELYQRELLGQMNRKAILLQKDENAELALIVNLIMEKTRWRRPYYKECVKGLVFALMAELIGCSESKARQETVPKKNYGVSQITAALDLVRMEYGRLVRVEELAKVCHMSETHFRRVFESCMNMSPVDYINLVRIQKACDLLKTSNDSMDIIAQKVGFTTTSTFNRNFKKILNTSPYQWKINPDNYEGKLLNYHISALKGW